MISFKDADVNNIYLVEEMFKNNKIKSRRLTTNKTHNKIVITFNIRAGQKHFSKLDEELMQLEMVTDFY